LSVEEEEKIQNGVRRRAIKKEAVDVLKNKNHSLKLVTKRR
jgi:hypothetical protein